MWWSVVLVVYLANACNGQIFGFGGCPAMKSAIDNFDGNQFAKEWYEVARTVDITRLGERCTVTNVTVVNNGTLVFSKNARNIFGSEINDYQMAEPNIGGHQFTVQAKLLNIGYTYPLTILDTDYINYAILYSCNNLPLSHTEYLWLWQTDRWQNTNNVFGHLQKFGWFKDSFDITDQSTCTN